MRKLFALLAVMAMFGGFAPAQAGSALGSPSVERGSYTLGHTWSNGIRTNYVDSTPCNASHPSHDVADIADTPVAEGGADNSCSKARFFSQRDFGGDSVLCTPYCANFNSLPTAPNSVKFKD